MGVPGGIERPAGVSTAAAVALTAILILVAPAAVPGLAPPM